METENILFFEEEIDLRLDNEEAVKSWICNMITSEGFENTGEINYIFCSDDYLLKINQTYLDHDTYTDIITFDNSHTPSEIAGDIFISVERVKENAQEYSVSFHNELYRVMAHGILHLCGYDDSTKEEIELMRERESHYLEKIKA